MDDVLDALHVLRPLWLLMLVLSLAAGPARLKLTPASGVCRCWRSGGSRRESSGVARYDIFSFSSCRKRFVRCPMYAARAPWLLLARAPVPPATIRRAEITDRPTTENFVGEQWLASLNFRTGFRFK